MFLVQSVLKWMRRNSRQIEVRNFHGLGNFYRHFVKDFSTITVPLMNIVKKSIRFYWGVEQEHAFSIVKDMMGIAPISSLPNFYNTFEIECDISGIGIGAILRQE